MIERYQNVIYENEIIEKKKKKIDLEFTLEKSKRGNLTMSSNDFFKVEDEINLFLYKSIVKRFKKFKK